MAQQQAPSVGEVMDGYRFKGGDPAQQSSWEQVAPVDVSSEYGAGARRLPNGVIERVGPRGGVQRIAAANAEGGDDVSLRAAADLRGRLTLGLGPVSEAQQRIEAIERDGYSFNDDWLARGVDAIPGGDAAARIIGGDDYQRLETASRSFEAAMLPVFSGAAVTESEAKRFIRANLPSLGDNAETLATKSRNRRLMTNAAATLIGQDLPYPDLGVFGAMFGGEAQEMPYDVAAPVAAARGLAGDEPQGPAAPPAPEGPAGPGSGPDSPVDISGLSAEDLMSLQPGQYIRFPDGRVERLSGAPRAGAEGEEVSPGVFQSREEAAAEYHASPFAQQQAFQRAALEQFPGGDEAMAAFAGMMSGNSYSDARKAQRGLSEMDRENNSTARNLGGVAGGTALMATPFGAPLRVTAGATRAGRAVNAAAGGAAAGGAWGFGQGEGNALERAPGAAGGAALGAVVGPLAAPVANALNRGVIQPIVGAARGGFNALRGRAADPLVSGVNRFADRSPQQVNALNDSLAQFQAEQIAPALADVVNDGGRGTLRALATRQTPARQAARDFADGRVEALPGRLSRQARRIVSDDARPVDEIVGGLTEARGAQARTTYAEPYAQPVAIDPQTAQALSGAPGRAALQRARAAAEAFNDAPAMQEIDALASGEVNEVSAATLDRIRQALSGRAERLGQNPATRAVGAGVAQRAGMVDEALEGVEGLAPARDAYRQASRQIGATEMGGRFMNANPDEFAGAMQGLSPEQLQPARAATARSIEIAARNPGSAPGVARRLYADPETANMGQAVMGDDMARLSNAARAEAGAVRNAIEINPRAGSPTNLNQNDSLNAAGEALGAFKDMASGNLLALPGRAISAIRNRGFSDAEAEAIVTAAIDPQQTERLIGMLAERMSRREARSLARAVRYQLTTGPQSGQQN